MLPQAPAKIKGRSVQVKRGAVGAVGWPGQAKRCEAAETATPKTLAPGERDIGLGRGAILFPVTLVARLHKLVVVGKGRIPVLDIQLVRDAWKLRRQVGVIGSSLQRHQAAQTKTRCGILYAPLNF